jgi:hypothetical protein
MAYQKPKPVLRHEAWLELQTALTRILNSRIGIPYQSCLNCKHWHFGKDLCGKFNTRPPTDIIVYSCDDYEDSDDIPF